MNDSKNLTDMMLREEPLEAFQDLLLNNRDNLDWGYLLHMCYCEESYESVGGDFGDEDNPPINHERIAYLKKLIEFLEDNGIEESESDSAEASESKEETSFTVSEDIYVMAEEPDEDITPDALRLWLKDNPSERNLAIGISIANNNWGWYGHDCYEDEKYIPIYNAWWELYQELVAQGFEILEKENEEGIANHDLSDIGLHCKIKPIMERNGFIDGNGWWVRDCDEDD